MALGMYKKLQTYLELSSAFSPQNDLDSCAKIQIIRLHDNQKILKPNPTKAKEMKRNLNKKCNTWVAYQEALGLISSARHLLWQLRGLLPLSPKLSYSHGHPFYREKVGYIHFLDST